LRSGPVVQVLPGKITYADLDRLEQKDVDAMFEVAMDTPALVLDMRGYPNGTAWSIAPRLNVKGAKVGASFRRNLVMAMPSEGSLSLAFDQNLPTTDKAPYRGKVVMLINQETMSQAEHTGLFFESACDVTFVGSPTTGANGDVTSLLLPGGVRISFTGHDVRHADGRQLQRVGLQPHIHVTPTLEGLRSGKDEVLERALEFLRTGH
jgi:C-terminal processing protease CtpA/Prc